MIEANTIHRPLQDVAWAEPLRQHAQAAYGTIVTINPETSFRIEMVTPAELRGFRLPYSRSIEYVEHQLARALPATFYDELEVETKGVSYLTSAKAFQNRSLILKIRGNDALQDETDAILDVLGGYGVAPKHGAEMWFNVVLGRVAAEAFKGGVAKQRFRHDLADRIPSRLVVGAGLIQLHN